jgi:hypothetical protein
MVFGVLEPQLADITFKKKNQKKMRVARMFMMKKQHAIKFLANKKTSQLNFNR